MSKQNIFHSWSWSYYPCCRWETLQFLSVLDGVNVHLIMSVGPLPLPSKARGNFLVMNRPSTSQSLAESVHPLSDRFHYINWVNHVMNQHLHYSSVRFIASQQREILNLNRSKREKLFKNVSVLIQSFKPISRNESA